MARKREWFETFFAGLYKEALAHQFSEQDSRRQARTVRRVLGLRKGARVLDIPCGMGRLALPLARMGLEMTGADLQESYIRRARRDAKRAGARIRYLACDMRDIEFDGEFDAVVNWFTSFGYFSDEDNLLFLKKVRRALRPGGRLLIDTMNKSRLLATWQSHSEKVIAGVHISDDGTFDRKTGRCLSRWTLSKGAQRETRRLVIKAFDAPEMRAILRAAGFRDVRLYGMKTLHDGVPMGRLTRHSRRMLAVATRPAR
jgi:2-polyprenyl-3-methyl-5-hydroxy-6-metoxy-1,4-benzoquinol methylase